MIRAAAPSSEKAVAAEPLPAQIFVVGCDVAHDSGDSPLPPLQASVGVVEIRFLIIV